jgi:hypothetical protein
VTATVDLQPRTCPECGTAFTVPFARRQKRFCSRRCAAIMHNRTRPPRPLAERVASFWSRVDKTETCWLWTGAKSVRGYGVAGQRPSRLAHRVAYEYLVGQIPEGLDLDHLCRVLACVNPDHLEPVPHRINVLRGESPAAQNAVKTHCKRGHSLSGDNLYVFPSGGRMCRTCYRAAARRTYAARRDAAVAGDEFVDSDPAPRLRRHR